MAASQVRQNFDRETEATLNRHLNTELYAGYAYRAMALFFDRDDIALPSFANYFEQLSKQENEQAKKLMEYQNKRGGRVAFRDVKGPEKQVWSGGCEAFQDALDLQKAINRSTLEVHVVASQRKDRHLCQVLQKEFLDKQVDAIRELGGHVTNLKRVGPGLGEYMYDQYFSE